MSEFSGVDGLLAGDVLLYRTTSLMGRAIRLLDGTEVSHAALFLGDRVAEALAREGLVQRPVAESIDDATKWVAVMRVRPVPGPMVPVLDVARTYLDQGNRYGYEQILLLAGICLTRKLDVDNPLLRRLVRAAMRKAADWMGHLHAEGKEPMICSEFVFRTYDEALPEPDDPYSLEILSQTAGRPRRGFSGFRYRRGLFGGETRPEAPSVHPDSLLARMQAAGEMPAALPAALSAAASRMAKTAAEPAAVAEPAEDLDALIECYLAEAEGVEAASAPPVAAGPEVSMDDLFDSARRLTANLAEAAAGKAETENRLYGAREGLADATPRTLADATPRTFADTVANIVADFVTPGDLLKSPSLERVGTL